MQNFKLLCSHCSREHDIAQLPPRCSECNEPLEIIIALNDIDKSHIKTGEPSMWRYENFIFVKRLFSLSEGWTPLLKADSISGYTGLRNIYLKNETVNPTGSFKDRGTSVGVNYALHNNYNHVGTVSTGNMAKSVAAYAAKAGIKSRILVKDSISDDKLKAISMYDPEILKYIGNYGELYFKSYRRYKDVFFINSDFPARVEGQKTAAYEICEQLDWKAPDFVLIPTSSGGNFSALYKGFKEFLEAGFIKSIPVMIAVQAEGSSPIFRAFEEGKLRVTEFPTPHTIAHAIENPFPPSGNRVLHILKENEGLSIAVNDREILDAQKLLAVKEGIFGQPASAATLAALMKLKETKLFGKNARIVLVISGTGLNDYSVFRYHEMKCEEISEL